MACENRFSISRIHGLIAHYYMYEIFDLWYWLLLAGALDLARKLRFETSTTS